MFIVTMLACDIPFGYQGYGSEERACEKACQSLADGMQYTETAEYPAYLLAITHNKSKSYTNHQIGLQKLNTNCMKFYTFAKSLFRISKNDNLMEEMYFTQE